MEVRASLGVAWSDDRGAHATALVAQADGTRANINANVAVFMSRVWSFGRTARRYREYLAVQCPDGPIGYERGLTGLTNCCGGAASLVT